MSASLSNYLQDHLAGAAFALSLLQDLSKQKVDAGVANFAAELLPEIEANRSVLELFAKQIGDGPSVLKEAAAWATQKVGRFKLTLTEPVGIFEAVETLALGVLGKLALWKALEAVRETDGRVQGLDLEKLISRAQSQHQSLESWRLKIAATALSDKAT